MGISVSAVSNYAFSEGIHKSVEYMHKHSTRFKKGSRSRTYFKKGHVPANKGKKLTEPQLERMRPTMFKKGIIPHNTLQDGAITYRKVKKEKGPSYFWVRESKNKWVPLHRHVWRHHNGEVPAGHVVRFKDGNQYNCNIDNLECITLKENRYRNTYYNFMPPELAEVKKMQIVIKRMINKQLKSK